MTDDAGGLTIVVDRITYQNPQNGYMVLRATGRGLTGGITVVGNFGPVQPGEELRVWGDWCTHPQFGPQFKARRYTSLKPSTLRGIERYLGSGMIKGIGPVTARRLVKAFGVETLTVIESDPERIRECDGIGPVRAQRIIEGWARQKAVRDVMVFLQGHGVSSAFAVRIYRRFGDDAVAVVRDNPYLLAEEVRGIGFKTADRIAAEFGIAGADPRRIRAALLHLLLAAMDEGHLFLREPALIAGVGKLLDLETTEPVPAPLAAMIDEKRLWKRSDEGGDRIYLPFLCRQEEGSAAAIARRLRLAVPPPGRERLLAAMQAGLAAAGVALTDRQALAIEMSLRERMLVLTGGPGTGKTTTLRALVAAQAALGRSLLLASPTGRAARRLAEVAGRPAVTIHRLLEFSPAERRFQRDRERPLACDALVVDEASMLDQELCHAILAALPPAATLVLVGDVDQLPSVGPGLVLRHLIDSGVVPVVRLDAVFRQARASLIITNAHRVNVGRMPKLIEPDGQTATDCYYVAADDPDAALALIAKVVAQSLPRRFGYDPLSDIQVLTPMNRGSLGTISLNQRLQEILNPPNPGRAEIGNLHRRFRVGDKVIQTRNNYDLEVFNGDLGLIRAIDTEEQEVVIEFAGQQKTFDASDLLDLNHAYAVTVHKAQGSEFPCVVLPMTTQHYPMLARNLLYTGMTRARRTLVLLGGRAAIGIAVRNNRPSGRNTVFAALLRAAAGGSPEGATDGSPASGEQTSA